MAEPRTRRRKRLIQTSEVRKHAAEKRAAEDAPVKKRTRRLKQTAMIKAIEQTRGLVGLACRRAGVSDRTHRDWMNRYPDYAQKFHDAVGIGYDMVEFRLLEKIDEGDVTAMRTFLAARCKERGYGISRSEQSGINGRAIEVNSNSPTMEEIIQATPADDLAIMVGKVRANANRIDTDSESG